MEDDRLNSPSTSAIDLEVLGHHLHISQEKNCRKGRFCPSKLKGKRVIELGAGCGLAGIGMALLGCDVISTDQTEVLPLLMRNVEWNTSYITQANPDSASFGSIKVAVLDWGNEEHIKAFDPPFDFVIGTDVVYAEHLLEPLLQTILALSGPRTTILLGYEIRSTAVHERMINMWKSTFVMKTIPKAKMDKKYQHPSIQLFMMELKTQSSHEDNICNAGLILESNHINEEDGDNCADEEGKDSGGLPIVYERQTKLKDRKVDDWEIRRYGSMAARLLRDVKIT